LGTSAGAPAVLLVMLPLVPDSAVMVTGVWQKKPR
jgi:hypothetical protein